MKYAETLSNSWPVAFLPSWFGMTVKASGKYGTLKPSLIIRFSI